MILFAFGGTDIVPLVIFSAFAIYNLCSRGYFLLLLFTGIVLGDILGFYCLQVLCRMIFSACIVYRYCAV